LREEGQIDGQVKLYNVDDDGEFESDPAELELTDNFYAKIGLELE